MASVLTLLNSSLTHACVQRNSGSVVDITFATPSIAACTADWRVDDAGSLFDQRYISFGVGRALGAQGPTRRPSPFPCWVLPKSDKDNANGSWMR